MREIKKLVYTLLVNFTSGPQNGAYKNAISI